MFLVFAAIIGVICAIIASSKGRSVIGWFFIGFLLGLIGLIICCVMPNLKEQREKEEQMKMEQRRLEEQLRQERIKNQRFQQYAKTRLDIHDENLQIDTRQPFSTDQAESLRLMNNDNNSQESSSLEQGFNEKNVSITSDTRQTGWYFQGEGEDYGPLTIRQIRQHITDGTIQHSTQVWHRTFTSWMPADQTDLFDFGDAV